jgi:ABC-type polysaccharide/polyol phosphate transport system ATPase subunit
MAKAIEIINAGKRYTKYDDTPMLITSALHFRPRTRRNKLWAVRGVDLELGEGDSLGVIGRNGSGKTTLMSMMAGITAPSEGSVRVWGRIAPLIAVGVGFHRELTGRENIYVNGTMLGLTRAQIDRRLDEIIDFAEIEEFIDTPVKFYSSGMYVRLGFSVAVHSDPQVLLIDEVLAVGDLAFQMKCFEKMSAILNGGTAIVVITHNMGGVVRFCQRVLFLHDGRPMFLGEPADAISRFHELLSEETEMQIDHATGAQFEPGVVRVESVDIVGAHGKEGVHLDAGQTVSVKMAVRAVRTVDDPVVGISVLAPDSSPLYVDNSGGTPLGTIAAGDLVTFSMTFRAQLPSGTYTVMGWVGRSDLRTVLAQSKPVAFFVAGRSTVGGVADLEALVVRQPAAPESGPAEHIGDAERADGAREVERLWVTPPPTAGAPNGAANPAPHTGNGVANSAPHTGNGAANPAPHTGNGAANPAPHTGNGVANSKART